jgi:hypothetical protein
MDIHSDAGSQIPDKFVHPIDIIEPIEGKTYTEDEVKLAIGLILHELGISKNPALKLDCIKAIFGLNVYEHKSLTSIATVHGVSRQAVDRCYNDLIERMGVVGGTFSKKSRSKEAYHLTNSQRSKTPKPTKEKPNNGTH